MIPGFNRSISLRSSRPNERAAYHLQSVSLPSRSNPLISKLEVQIQAVRTWAASSDASLAMIETGLLRIELLHSALHDFLGLSETKYMLRRGSTSTEHLLNNLLYLIDSYGLLLSTIESLKQKLFEVLSALRRHDANLIASSLKSLRRKEKELTRLASSLYSSTKCLPSEFSYDFTEAQSLSILKQAISATSAASVLVFNRLISVSKIASSAAISSASSRTVCFAKKGSKEERAKVALQKLKELEKCVEIVESESEKVFRSLVNFRVSLLNIQSDLF